MIVKIVIIMILFCSTYINGNCPLLKKGNTVVVLHHTINTDGLNDPTFTNDLEDFLARNYNITVTPENPAASCKLIAELMPHYVSGYYWIQGIKGADKVYCELGSNNRFGESGGWMRIANVDMRNDSQCPPGLVYNVIGGRRLCRRPSLDPGCSSTIFSTHKVEYDKVCGRVIGYQYGVTYGFGPSRSTPGINETYVDGVSVTHGSRRQHLWTFASASFETNPQHVNCPCLHPHVPFAGVIPSFVGNDYYCDTGSKTPWQRRYYFEDPLWDGEGCEGENECCNRGGPWFCKQLSQSTKEDIEMRVCNNNNNEEVVLEQIKLYTQ